MWFLLLLGLGAAFVAAVESSSRRRLEAPSEPRVIKPVTPTGPPPEERKAAALKARLKSLRAQFEPFSHYNDSAWLTRYAKEHMQWLLENRDEILDECKQLHARRLDPAFDVDMTYVYEHDRELYDRVMVQSIA